MEGHKGHRGASLTAHHLDFITQSLALGPRVEGQRDGRAGNERSVLLRLRNSPQASRGTFLSAPRSSTPYMRAAHHGRHAYYGVPCTERWMHVCWTGYGATEYYYYLRSAGPYDKYPDGFIDVSYSGWTRIGVAGFCLSMPRPPLSAVEHQTRHPILFLFFPAPLNGTYFVHRYRRARGL